ncbi:phage tail protein [Lysobacter sp. Root604]|uniref:phage tail protein n=1 Tax=Lysobacter sp. Root604 TaxID=1736568 RepID=UPI0009EB5498|nr:phage tail protein [Lysobacter sp. Root604]
MIKPTSLREHLTAAIPELGRDPDRLLVFIKDGSLVGTFAPGLSFEYRYTLNLIITDFSGHPDAVMVPLMVWIEQQQPELLANPALRERIAFDAELLANDKVDLELKLPLTERVGVHAREAGGYDVVHYPEPELETVLPGGRWDVYLQGEWIGGWDVVAAGGAKT